MVEVQDIEFLHHEDLNMDTLFRYLVDHYKSEMLMPFVGGYEKSLMEDNVHNYEVYRYRVSVILIEE